MSSSSAEAERIARALQTPAHPAKLTNGTWKTMCPVCPSAGSPTFDIGLGYKGQLMFHCWEQQHEFLAIVARLEERGLLEAKRNSLKLPEYAQYVELPVDFLKSVGASERESGNRYAVLFKCFDEAGNPLPRYRVRYKLHGPKKITWDKAGSSNGDKKGAPISAYGLNRLPQAREKKAPVVLVEGESDSQTLWFHGIHALGLPGCSMAAQITPETVKGIDKFVISQEPGTAGQTFRDLILRRLEALRWTGSVKIIKWTPECKDPSALYKRDHNGFADAYKKLLSEAELIEMKAELSSAIINAKDYLPVTTARAWATLLDADAARKPEQPRLYRYLNVYIRMDRADPLEKLIPVPLDEDALRHEMTRAALWINDQGQPVDPTGHQVQDLFATPAERCPLPILRKLINIPCYAPDGNLVVEIGYNEVTGYYLDLDTSLDLRTLVVGDPSEGEVQLAAELLYFVLTGRREPFQEVDGKIIMRRPYLGFPFVKPADLAHAIAYLIQTFVRDMISGVTPITAFEAPQARTGKDLLLETLLAISGIRAASHSIQPKDLGFETEFKKQITTDLREGVTAINISNLPEGSTLQSSVIADVITRTYWTDRILGVSRNLRVDPLRLVWSLTGNNPDYSDEMAARRVRCKIDAQCDSPEDRNDFAIPDLPGYVRDNRSVLIKCVLTLVEWWKRCGRPNWTGIPLGKFEPWSRIMGGILSSANIPGFLTVRPSGSTYVSPIKFAWRLFVTEWWKAYSTQTVTTADLFEIAKRIEGLDLGPGDEEQRKKVFAHALRRKRGNSLNTKQGDALAAALEVPSDVTIIQMDHKSGVAQWALADTLKVKGDIDNGD